MNLRDYTSTSGFDRLNPPLGVCPVGVGVDVRTTFQRKPVQGPFYLRVSPGLASFQACPFGAPLVVQQFKCWTTGEVSSLPPFKIVILNSL